jgi:hypothetical protein
MFDRRHAILATAAALLVSLAAGHPAEAGRHVAGPGATTRAAEHRAAPQHRAVTPRLGARVKPKLVKAGKVAVHAIPRVMVGASVAVSIGFAGVTMASGVEGDQMRDTLQMVETSVATQAPQSPARQASQPKLIESFKGDIAANDSRTRLAAGMTLGSTANTVFLGRVMSASAGPKPRTKRAAKPNADK